MKILGISAYYHDSSACLIDCGEVISAAQEERFTRIKHDSSFPKNSISFCLKQSLCKPEEIDAIVFFEKPFLKFERLVETYLAFAPRGFLSFKAAIPTWVKEKLFQKKLLHNELLELGFTKDQCQKILFSSHHLSHAASAFYPSPFDEALVLTMDGVGEWDTTTVYIGKNNDLKKIKELHFPHSLGLLYSAFTYYCGFKVNSGEYKLMGLAPYGKPIFVDKIKSHLVDIKDDGSFRLNMDYFDYCTGLTMTNRKFDELFEKNYRHPESELKQCHFDMAASIQFVLEEIVLKICRHLSQTYSVKNLCLAGGVALNCVANGKIHQSELFDNVWVQPAAGDAGGSIGAALAVYYQHFNFERITVLPDSMKGSFLGPEFSSEQIQIFLENKKAHFEKINTPALYSIVADLLSEGNVVGWFQGRMEFGPRALGNRSILADPRNSEMQKQLNLKIKFRESFRPFAPAVLEDCVSDWFDFSQTSPYMLKVAAVKADKLITQKKNSEAFGIELLNQVRSEIPAVTHIDNSARIQTVSLKTNPNFYNLISEFKNKTGVPILINTSFNIRGEPIVCSPEDAYRCFMGTNMDVLVLENYILRKENQPKEYVSDYKNQFELD